MTNYAYFLLPVALVLLFLFLRNDKKEYEDFKALTETEDRQRVLRCWVLKSFLMLGVSSLLGLLLIGEFSSLWAMPTAFQNLITDFDSVADNEKSGLDSFLGGVLSALKYIAIPGLLFGGLISTWVRGMLNRNKASDDERSTNEPILIGDIESLLPRTSGEKFWAVLMSLNAGLSEELFFRLFLPLLFFIVTGNVVLAFVVCSILFGIAHGYQGLVGVCATAVFGIVMLLIYLMSHSIWLVIAVHAILDLNALIFIPWLSERMESTGSKVQPESVG